MTPSPAAPAPLSRSLTRSLELSSNFAQNRAAGCAETTNFVERSTTCWHLGRATQ